MCVGVGQGGWVGPPAGFGPLLIGALALGGRQVWVTSADTPDTRGQALELALNSSFGMVPALVTCLDWFAHRWRHCQAKMGVL